MFDSFYISEEYIGEFIAAEEIADINNSIKTKEPIIITEFGVGDITGPQILIEVGIGLISALAYDVLKAIVFKIKDAIKKKHCETNPGDPSPVINFNIDAEDANIELNVKIDCMASKEDTERSIKVMKKHAQTIVQDNKEIDFNTEVL